MLGRLVKQGAPPPYIAYYAVLALPGGDINFREESYWPIKKNYLEFERDFLQACRYRYNGFSGKNSEFFEHGKYFILFFEVENLEKS